MQTKRTLAFLLVLAMLLSLFPVSVIAANAEPEANAEAARTEQTEETPERLHPMLDEQTARDRGHKERLRDEEGEHLNKLVYRNQDGTKTMYLYRHPVKYRDEQGQTHDISLEIDDTGDAAYPFRTRANSAVTEFPASLPDGITLRGNGVALRLSGQGHTGRRVDENTVAYTYDSKTTIEYALTYTGFKEDIVVSEYTGQTEYPFTLYTNGLYLTNLDGGYYLTDDAGTIQATIGDIIVFTADERNNTLGSLRVATVEPGQQYELTIVLDAEYLADPNTVYPIRIDPTVELVYTDETPNAIEEKTIQSNNTTNGSLASMYIGYGASGINRVLMKFPGLDFESLEGVTVTSAVVSIRDLLCETEEMTITCYPFTGSVWTESSSQWSNITQSWGTALSSHVISYSSGREQESTHRYRFDITALAQKWVDGYADPARGIIFRAESSVENGSDIFFKTFGTSERASYRPIFEITYQDVLSLEESNLDVDKGSTIILSASSVLGRDDGLTWVSSAPAVASVSESGVVTGLALGSTEITASYVDEDGNTISASCTVYVTVPDGVYYIQRAGSTKCLANEDSTVDSVSTHVEAKNTSTVTDPTQFWQITYMTDGWYCIRPVDRILAVLTMDNSKNVVVKDLVENATIHLSNRWKIIQESSGYVFLHRGLSSTAMTATSLTDGANVTLAPKTANNSCHWTLLEAKGVVLRDTATQRAIPSSTIKTVELGDTVTPAGLGMTWDFYGTHAPCDWSTSEPITLILEFDTFYITNIGEAVITLSALFSGVESRQSFKLRSVNTVNIEVIYDQAYATRYSNTISRINTQMAQLQEYYLLNFYIQINVTSVEPFTSYADANCYSDPNKACDHGGSCANPNTQTTEPEPQPYHHKNFGNIFWRIPHPDITQTFKIAFIGHTVCSAAACSGNSIAPWGLSSPLYGLAAVADHRSDADELVTLIHEFGHLVGALDHYGGSGYSTQSINDSKVANAEFHSNCLYGEDQENMRELSHVVFCPGCCELIHDKTLMIRHGYQGGNDDDNRVEFS